MKVIEYSVENYMDVQIAINNGWQPWGSPFERTIEQHVEGHTYRKVTTTCQAMVRYEEKIYANTTIDDDEYNPSLLGEPKPSVEFVPWP